VRTQARGRGFFVALRQACPAIPDIVPGPVISRCGRQDDAPAESAPGVRHDCIGSARMHSLSIATNASQIHRKSSRRLAPEAAPLFCRTAMNQ